MNLSQKIANDPKMGAFNEFYEQMAKSFQDDDMEPPDREKAMVMFLEACATDMELDSKARLQAKKTLQNFNKMKGNKGPYKYLYYPPTQ